MKKTIRVPLGDLQIHPLVLQMKQYKPNHFMIFSLKNFGQKTAVVVVMRKDRHYIIDGGHRYYSAVEAGNVDTLECVVLDDEELLE